MFLRFQGYKQFFIIEIHAVYDTARALFLLPINAIFMSIFILYNLLMDKKKAKLIFKHNYFDIIEEEITFCVLFLVGKFYYKI